MKKRRTIELYCQCGQLLAKYKKGGKGRLVKMFLGRISEDVSGIFLTDPKRKLNEEIYCPSCNKRVATIQIINGKYAAKVNQGGVRY